MNGTAAPAPKAPELRLEMTAADGTPIGLLLTKCRKHAQNPPAEMYVYSVTPRHAGQPAAKELKFSEASGAVEFIPTDTPLMMSDGTKLYAWARVHDTSGFSPKLLVFAANAAGTFPKRRVAEEAGYVGRGTSIVGAASRWSRSDSPAGGGCALVRSVKPPTEVFELFGCTPGPKGRPPRGDVLTLDIAAGVDAVLMVGFAVLWEKATAKEHFDMGGVSG